MTWLLEVRDLCKSYSSPVLRNFSFELAAGEVHALVGSNGAGKSTLARILCGLTTPDSGEMLLAGRPHFPTSRNDAADAGVVMVMQELNVIPALSVAENLFLERLPAHAGFIRYGQLRTMAVEALARVGLQELDPFTLASSLGVGRQQMVEIAAGLNRECKVLILDEPTAALTGREVEHLFENIRQLRSQGVAILYVSHRMDEIRVIADRVTVLRDGARISTHTASAVSAGELVKEMAGHEIAAMANTEAFGSGEVILRAGGIRVDANSAPVSLEVRAGEVLGIAGLAGSGRSELLRALYDSASRVSGTLEICGKEIRGGPDRAVRAGLGLIPEDRKMEGLLLPLSIRENTTLSTLDRHASRLGWLRDSDELATTERVREELDVRCASLEQAVSFLSGGNQQKVLLGRWLARDCTVLLLDEPTRGVDAAAKDQIHSLLRSLSQAGKALVLVSSELEELMALSHRIIVLSAGRVAGEFLPENWTRQKITEAAFSGYADMQSPHQSAHGGTGKVFHSSEI